MSQPTSDIQLVSNDRLRDLLTPVLGARPSREMLVRWRDEGMPHIPLGARTIRYDLNDVLGWIRAQTVTRVFRP